MARESILKGKPHQISKSGLSMQSLIAPRDLPERMKDYLKSNYYFTFSLR